MKRLAIVDARAGQLFVSSYSTTAADMYVQGDWVEPADAQCDDARLGQLVRSALASSRTGIPHPDYLTGPTPERLRLLKLAGVKSETQFASGTREASIEFEEGSGIRVTPHRNGGRRAGFTEMLDQVIAAEASADDHALGSAVRRALSIATDGT